MSIVPKYTGELQRYGLGGIRWKMYQLATSQAEVSQLDMVNAFGQTAGNWYNRFSELVLTGMMEVVPGKAVANPVTGETMKVYRITSRQKPLLLCLSTHDTIKQLSKDLRSVLGPAAGHTAQEANKQLGYVSPYLRPQVIGTVDGKLLRQRYQSGLEPNLPLIKGWKVVLKH